MQSAPTRHFELREQRDSLNYYLKNKIKFPKVLGLVGEFAYVEDERIAEILAKCLGRRMQMMIVEHYSDIDELKNIASLKDIDVLALQTQKHKWAELRCIDTSSEQRYVKLQPVLNAKYMINELILTRLGIQRELREKLFFMYFGMHSLIFDTEDNMKKYIASHGIRGFMSNLQTRRIQKPDGIVTLGRDVSPIFAIFSGLPPEMRDEFKNQILILDEHKRISYQMENIATTIQTLYTYYLESKNKAAEYDTKIYDIVRQVNIQQDEEQIANLSSQIQNISQAITAKRSPDSDEKKSNKRQKTK